MTIDLVVQGPIGEYTQQILDAAEACPRINKIILSHWKLDKEKVKIPSKCLDLKNEAWDRGWNNFNLNKQAYTTVNGLAHATSDYVIKLRSAKWPYVNLNAIIDKFQENPDKVLSSSFFFRRHDVHPFHCSDHLLVSKRKELSVAFQAVLDRCLSHDINRPYYGSKNQLLKGTSPAVEQIIGDEILSARNVTSRTKQDMKDNFEIIRIDTACNLRMLNNYRRNQVLFEVPRHAIYNVVNEIQQL